MWSNPHLLTSTPLLGFASATHPVLPKMFALRICSEINLQHYVFQKKHRRHPPQIIQSQSGHTIPVGHEDQVGTTKLSCLREKRWLRSEETQKRPWRRRRKMHRTIARRKEDMPRFVCLLSQFDLCLTFFTLIGNVLAQILSHSASEWSAKWSCIHLWRDLNWDPYSLQWYMYGTYTRTFQQAVLGHLLNL